MRLNALCRGGIVTKEKEHSKSILNYTNEINGRESEQKVNEINTKTDKQKIKTVKVRKYFKHFVTFTQTQATAKHTRANIIRIGKKHIKIYITTYTENS